jgi:Protein of unknown function (DUF1566)
MATGIQPTLAAVAVLLASSSVLAQQRCEADPSLQSTPTARFEDHGDGTVTDRQLKLMWTRCSAGQTWAAGTCSGQAGTYTWEAAGRLASELNQRGSYFYSDWRLPQLRELATLIERACSSPRVNLSVFPNTPAGIYWSATPRPGAQDPSSAYALGFGSDGVEYQAKDVQSHVRLVRRAQ